MSMDRRYAVSTHGKIFHIEGQSASGWEAPGFPQALQVEGDSFHGFYVQVGEQRIRASVIEVDFRLRTVILLIQHYRIELRIQDEQDLQLLALGLPDPAGKKATDLRSPMPGLVFSIPVQVGDTVRKGEPLLILEAMKMENVLKAPSDVVVAEIKVVQGQAVEKNQPLILFG
jgi:acetyl/propionyl-CoA carboxylase alpha subunit